MELVIDLHTHSHYSRATSCESTLEGLYKWGKIKGINVIGTGLSSDPFMNWRLDQLRNVTIISNSDAHSPSKLGREATVLQCNLDYFDIEGALKSNDQRIIGTIEFFPEEGKYHYDGHRDHNIRFSPKQTKEHQGICPVIEIIGEVLSKGTFS